MAKSTVHRVGDGCCQLFRVISVLCSLALIVSTIVPTISAAQTVNSPQLMTNGTQIVLGDGTMVILRGVDLSGYEYVPPIQWSHYESDYATIASWGFNVVRLPISWENLEPQAGVYSDSYLQKVDQDVAWAEQYGIYIVLDMHQYCWSSQFTSCDGQWSAGIPKWGVSGYPDNNSGMQLMIHDFFSGLGPNGTPPSPSNPSMQQRFFAAWKHVASRYRNETAIAGYDVLNEPSVGYNNVDSTFTSTILPSFYTNAIDAVRTVDSYHICFWEPPTDIAIQRANVAYAPHYPGGWGMYGGTSALTASMMQIISLSHKWNVPVFIGEWGMRADAPGVVQYINDSLYLYDTYSIGAAWWDYSKTTWPMSLFNPDGTPRSPLLENLVRPFARQVSSPAILSTTYNGFVQSLEVRGTTVPTRILISIPLGYSVESIQANAGPFLIWTFSARGLLLHLPVTVSEVRVQYSR